MSKNSEILLAVISIIIMIICAWFSFIVIFLLAGSSFSEQVTTALTYIKDLASTIQSIGTVGAIIGGGIWGYRLFKLNREDQVKATIKHIATSRRMMDSRIFLHIVVTLSNTSNVALTVVREQLRVQQILPIPSGLEEAIKEYNGALQSNESTILWPHINYHDFDWPDDPMVSMVIEPKESHPFTYGFILNKEITVIRISSLFTAKHPFSRKWELITIHDVPSSSKIEEGTKSSNEEDKNEDAA